MKANEAVKIAVGAIAEFFVGDAHEVALEELQFDSEKGEWLVTIGFFRRWDRTPGAAASLLQKPPQRTYKRVAVTDSTGEVASITNAG